jgi:hypothetical protein
MISQGEVWLLGGVEGGVSQPGNAPLFLVAVGYTKEARHLVLKEANPKRSDQDYEDGPQ